MIQKILNGQNSTQHLNMQEKPKFGLFLMLNCLEFWQVTFIPWQHFETKLRELMALTNFGFKK